MTRIAAEPYKPRPIRFLELWQENDWQVKIYGISSLAEKPEPEFIETAKNIAREALPSPAVVNDLRYGAGFIVIHRAALFNQIIVDWWERANELRHHVFKSEPENPHSFANITASGEAFCVWELRVIGFERAAWLEVLRRNDAEDAIEEYLTTRCSED